MDTSLLKNGSHTKQEYIQLLDTAIRLTDDLHSQIDCIDKMLKEDHQYLLAA